MSQKILFYEELKTKNIFELIPVFNEFLLKWMIIWLVMKKIQNKTYKHFAKCA